MPICTTCVPLLVRCGMTLSDAQYMRRALHTLNRWPPTAANGAETWKNVQYRNGVVRKIARTMRKYPKLRHRITVDAQNVSSLHVLFPGGGRDGITID